MLYNLNEETTYEILFAIKLSSDCLQRSIREITPIIHQQMYNFRIKLRMCKWSIVANKLFS